MLKSYINAAILFNFGAFVIVLFFTLLRSQVPFLESGFAASTNPLTGQGGDAGSIPERRIYSWDEILDAIWIVESSGQYDPPAGDGGKAIGPYQIHTAYWRDGTKFLGVKWPYRDARDFNKARAVTYAYLRHYGAGLAPLEAARCHNGGPNGYKYTVTLQYKVQLLKILQFEK